MPSCHSLQTFTHSHYFGATTVCLLVWVAATTPKWASKIEAAICEQATEVYKSVCPWWASERESENVLFRPILRTEIKEEEEEDEKNAMKRKNMPELIFI